MPCGPGRPAHTRPLTGREDVTGPKGQGENAQPPERMVTGCQLVKGQGTSILLGNLPGCEDRREIPQSTKEISGIWKG